MTPTLYFKNPVFHQGRNLTCRRGVKWDTVVKTGVRVADIGDGSKIGHDNLEIFRTDIETRVVMFNQINNGELGDEHDPKCRTYEGLLNEMRRIYPGFSPWEIVTLVSFNSPIDYPDVPDWWKRWARLDFKTKPTKEVVAPLFLVPERVDVPKKDRIFKTHEFFNKLVPIGTKVRYYPIFGNPQCLYEKTRSEAWTLENGEVVVKITRVAGGVSVLSLRVGWPTDPNRKPNCSCGEYPCSCPF